METSLFLSPIFTSVIWLEAIYLTTVLLHIMTIGEIVLSNPEEDLSSQKTVTASLVLSTYSFHLETVSHILQTSPQTSIRQKVFNVVDGEVEFDVFQELLLRAGKLV